MKKKFSIQKPAGGVLGASAIAPVLTLAMVLGSAGMATAHGGEMRGAQMFKQIDADGDGRVTQAELDQFAAERFARIDSDADGLLSADELTAAQGTMRARRAQRMMTRLDTDGDGLLSVEEMAQRRGANLIERADADGDGALTLDEMRDARKTMRAAH